MNTKRLASPGRFLVFAVSLLCTVACFSFAVVPRAAFAANEADSVFSDAVIRGGISVEKNVPLGKKQGDTTVEGTVFEISLAQGNPVWVNGMNGWQLYSIGDPIVQLVTDANGKAATPANLLPYGTYNVKEYAVNDGQHGRWSWVSTVSIREEGKIVAADSVTNELFKGSIGVTKRDANYDTATEGDMTWAGVEFEVYNRSAAPIQYLKNGTRTTVAVNGLVDTIVTDESGYAELPALSLDYGTYEVIEKDPHTDQTGFLPQSPAWSSGLIELRKHDRLYQTDICYNEPVRGGVQITKYDREANANSPQGDGRLNAVYAIYNASPAPVKVAGTVFGQGVEVCRITANPSTGVASTASKYLPWGTYTVREVVPPTGYEVDSSWSYTFSVRADGHVYSPTESAGAASENRNNPIRGGIQVQKVDADTGKRGVQGNGTFAGIELTIYNRSDTRILYKGKWIDAGQEVCKLTLDAKGQAATGEYDLPYGTYEIRETYVPASTGYNRNALWSQTFRIIESGDWVEVSE